MNSHRPFAGLQYAFYERIYEEYINDNWLEGKNAEKKVTKKEKKNLMLIKTENNCIGLRVKARLSVLIHWSVDG